MNIAKIFIFSLVPLSWGVLLQFPAWADNSVIITPKVLNVSTVRGKNESRTIVLRGTQPLSDLKVTSIDLYNAEGSKVLPASSLKIKSLSDRTETNNLIKIPLKFTLEDAPSGEFKGEIIISSKDKEWIIPTIVKIKDPLRFPLLTLVLGLVLGMAVSAYSSGGKLSDEITVNLDKLSKQIDSDRESSRTFYSRTNSYLELAQSAQNAKQLKDADTELTKARETWRKWLRDRSYWLMQFEYCDRLQERLDSDDLMSSSLYIQTINRDLEDYLYKCPDFDNVGDLREKLDSLSQQLNTYLKLKIQLDKLRDLASFTEGEEGYQWEDKADEFEQTLNTLLPSNQNEITSLQVDIKTTITDVQKVISKQPTSLIPKDVDGSIQSQSELVLQPTATINNRSPYNLLSQITSLWRTAKGRLRLFYLSSYLISFTVLAGSGFNELYLSKPTFGANGWGDYLALLAWGFGAEATRNMATQVVKKTDESDS